LDHLLWPNGQRTNYTWKPNAQDQRLESITHLDVTAATQSQHTYGYDTAGKILTWQRVVAGSTALDTLGYNASDELEQDVQTSEPSHALLHGRGYGYDAGGNRTAVTEDGKLRATRPMRRISSRPPPGRDRCSFGKRLASRQPSPSEVSP